LTRLSKLRFQYGEGDFSLRIPALSVAGGGEVAVIGPSRSGKTTVLHLFEYSREFVLR
jgi:ABC-type bacteriocin/lantibiotic exporter with double-glycine peptidase domain